MSSFDEFFSCIPYLCSALGQGLGFLLLVFSGFLIVLGLVGSLLPASAGIEGASAFLVGTGTRMVISGCALLAGGLLTWSTLDTLSAAQLTDIGNDAFVVGAIVSAIGILILQGSELRSLKGKAEGRALAIMLIGCLVMASGASTVFIA
jgi:hypothetical protein